MIKNRSNPVERFRSRFELALAPLLFAAACLCSVVSPSIHAQNPSIRLGSNIPSEVDTIYEKGLAFLAASQQKDGSWRGRSENGVTGLCLMAFLASGEDPNFGRYRQNVRRAVRALISGQDAKSGFFPSSMYHHGFALLALAEAYGAVDEAALWSGKEKPENHRSIAEALELGIQLAVSAQKNNRWGGWRYAPTATDSDTSVTGAVLMGLFACQNAGLEVPEQVIEAALTYMKRSTSSTGFVAYSGGIGGGGESMARSSVATLVFAVGHQKDSEEYKAVLNHITAKLDHEETGHRHYFLYYMAQALFQGDYDSWDQWNRRTLRTLAETQADDGSFTGSYGEAYGTAMSLLALGLNYRFLPIYERF